MIDRLVFEDVIGSVHFSSIDETFFGKLEGVNDLVTFEGENVKDLKKALCEQTGKNVNKSFKGSFNVRIDPKLHELAYIKATKEGISLNQLVQVALKKQLVK